MPATKRRMIATDPLARKYKAALRADVHKAREVYMSILLDRGFLEAIKRDQVRRAGEKSIKKIVPIRRGVKAARGEEEFVRRMILDDFRDTTDDLTAELQLTIDSHDLEAYNLGGRAGQLRLGYRGVFNLRNVGVLSEITTRAKTLGELFADDVVDGIVKDITVGFYDKGQNPLEVARQLNQRFTEFELSRCENIARTEVNIMSESATFRQYQRVQIELKQWLAFVDRKTRPDHRDISEQDPIPMSEPFIMPHTGDEVMHPGDGRAPARQLCRCRCTLLPVLEDVEIKEDRIWTGD
jgi:hypothetical protein